MPQHSLNDGSHVSKNRNFDKSPLSGPARSYEINPAATNPKEGQKSRGDENKKLFSFGAIPNKKG